MKPFSFKSPIQIHHSLVVTRNPYLPAFLLASLCQSILSGSESPLESYQITSQKVSAKSTDFLNNKVTAISKCERDPRLAAFWKLREMLHCLGKGRMYIIFAPCLTHHLLMEWDTDPEGELLLPRLNRFFSSKISGHHLQIVAGLWTLTTPHRSSIINALHPPPGHKTGV